MRAEMMLQVVQRQQQKQEKKGRILRKVHKIAPTDCPFPYSCVFKVDFEHWFNPLATNVSVI